MLIITLDYYVRAKISQPIDRKCHWIQGNLEKADNNHSASKCDKIVINFLKETASPDELPVVITVFITTGRIIVQGKGHEDWSKHEFLALLDIVNQLSFLKSFSNLSSVEDKSIFTGSVHNFFGNFVPDDDIPSLSHSVDIAIFVSLKITPEHLGTITSLRDTRTTGS